MTPYPHKKCPRPPHLGTEYGWGVGLLWDVRGGWRGHQVWQGNPHTVRLSEVAPRVRLPEFLVCQPPDLSYLPWEPPKGVTLLRMPLPGLLPSRQNSRSSRNGQIPDHVGSVLIGFPAGLPQDRPKGKEPPKASCPDTLPHRHRGTSMAQGQGSGASRPPELINWSVWFNWVMSPRLAFLVCRR